MRQGRASSTAMMAAYARGLGDLGITRVPGFRDAAAAQLLSGMLWRFLLRRARRLAATPSKRRERMIPHLDGILLRVAFIDHLLGQMPCEQVVILGAGLDTRAWRLPALRGVHLFEVDHPATQAYKRERAAKLSAPHVQPRYVAVDLTREELASALRAAGHDPDSPTVWIWEGVIMYLDDAALRGTLGAIRSASGPDSMLIAHYYEPPLREGFFRRLMRRSVLSWFGEPWLGVRRHDVMQHELTQAGFRVWGDADTDQQALAVGAPAPAPTHAGVSRVVWASSAAAMLAADGGATTSD
jgi:methyltransferase (TIGR00027 family)